MSVVLSETVYSAVQAILPYATITNIENNSSMKPGMTVSGFGNGVAGVLSAFVKNSSGAANTQGSISLTNNDDTGVYGNFLQITLLKFN